MRDYEPYKDEWKTEVGRATARFIMNVTAMVPLIAAAIALGLFVHLLFSEPFGFSCRSIAVERPVTTSKHRFQSSRATMTAPTSSDRSDKAPLVEPVTIDTTQE